MSRKVSERHDVRCQLDLILFTLIQFKLFGDKIALVHFFFELPIVLQEGDFVGIEII